MTLNPLKSNQFSNNFKRKYNGNYSNFTESVSDKSEICCTWHALSELRGKFITKKSDDPIPPGIVRVQEKLGFRPGEPVTKRNCHKLIYVGRPDMDRKINQVNEATPPYVTPPYRQQTQKNKPERPNDLPFKKQFFDRNGVPIPVIMHSYHEVEIIDVESRPSFHPKGLSSI